MKLEFYNGTTSFDVTNRVASIEPLHESIGDENGFVIPSLKFKLDNMDNYYRTFLNDVRADRVWVRLSTGTHSIFTGFLSHDVPMLSGKYNSLVGFEADHAVARMKEWRFEQPISIAGQMSKLKLYLWQTSWRQKPIEFDFFLFFMWSETADLDQTVVHPDYFSEPRVQLDMMGEICQLYGAVPIWDNDQLTLRTLTQIKLDENVIDITPMITSEQEPVDRVSSVTVRASDNSGADVSVKATPFTGNEVLGTQGRGVGIDVDWDVPMLPYIVLGTMSRENINKIVESKLQGYIREKSSGLHKVSVWVEKGWNIVPGRVVRFDGSTYFVEETFKHIAFEEKFKTQLILRHFKG